MFDKETEFLLERSLLLAGILVGFALRLFHLGAESLWYDETVSVHLARLPLANMLAHTAGDIHPPGYYALLHFWQQLTAPSLAHGLEFLFAWPSLMAGVVILALTYALGRRLFDARTGLVALWLAAVNPFQLWYSQEVRMYTVGAALALLALWAALRVLDRRRTTLWLVVYAVSAAAGLYTLYYFAFWLVAVNIVTLVLLLWRADANRGAQLGGWLAAQAGALLLFAPWLPIALRQVREPPVPPWRTPWSTFADVSSDLTETFGAQLTGQSPPLQVYWPWTLVVTAMLLAFIIWMGRDADLRRRRHAALLLAVTFLPLAQLYGITWLATPIYHVRYLFLYAPIFLLIPAALLAAAWSARPRWAASALALWLGVSAAASINFWLNPLYRADDHRSAVAQLAAAWRPGDVILANAGWIYPVLTTYWPQTAVGVEGSTPPELTALQRISDYTQSTNVQAERFTHPQIVRTGSIDGAATLGWGNPASDFFAASSDAHTDALEQIARTAHRIWHYRLYDTVSDPDGVIRQWLADHTALRAETPIAGRDFGMVQLFTTRRPSEGSTSAAPVCFEKLLCLDDYQPVERAATAGAYLYVPQSWRARQPLSSFAASLRLYDDADRLAAQADTPFQPATSDWQADVAQRQVWALPVGVSTKPGDYVLEMVVYRQEDSGALSLPGDAPSPDGQRLLLGAVTVLPAATVPELPPPLATFDYIELLKAQLDRTTARPGDSLRLTAYWRPRPNAYRDTYRVVATLQDAHGASAGEWRFTLGGDAYPSGAWPESLPVRDFYDLSLPTTFAAGDYTLAVALERASDGAPIATRQGWSMPAAVEIGAIRIEAP